VGVEDLVAASCEKKSTQVYLASETPSHHVWEEDDESDSDPIPLIDKMLPQLPPLKKSDSSQVD